LPSRIKGENLTQLEWKRFLLDLEDTDFKFETLDVAILLKNILQ